MHDTKVACSRCIPLQGHLHLGSSPVPLIFHGVLVRSISCKVRLTSRTSMSSLKSSSVSPSQQIRLKCVRTLLSRKQAKKAFHPVPPPRNFLILSLSILLGVPLKTLDRCSKTGFPVVNTHIFLINAFPEGGSL